MMTLNEAAGRLRNLFDDSADFLKREPARKKDVDACKAAIRMLEPGRQKTNDEQEMVLRDALEEVDHALLLVSCGCEAALAEEIARWRSGMLAALILAGQALQKQIDSLTAESEDEK